MIEIGQLGSNVKIAVTTSVNFPIAVSYLINVKFGILLYHAHVKKI